MLNDRLSTDQIENAVTDAIVDGAEFDAHKGIQPQWAARKTTGKERCASEYEQYCANGDDF